MATKRRSKLFPTNVPRVGVILPYGNTHRGGDGDLLVCGLLQYFLEHLSQDRALYSVALHTACVIALDVSITTMIQYLVKNCKGLQYTASNMIDSREGRC